MDDKALEYIARNVTEWPDCEKVKLVYPDPDGEIRFSYDTVWDFYPAEAETHRVWTAFLSNEKHYTKEEWEAARRALNEQT